MPAIEVVWVRFVGHAIFAILFLRPWRDLARYRSSRPFVQVLRSVFLFSSTVFNFLALRKLQLAETTSINFAGAFVIAGLAGPLLGEWIGPRRWAAIVVGFIGVLIVTRPGSAVFQPAVLFSIGSMLCSSGYVLLTRLLAATEFVGRHADLPGRLPAASSWRRRRSPSAFCRPPPQSPRCWQ